ncbi:2-hydroxychromene-2-carboxylate isomerase [Wenxinia marina]|uniref:2-hydroxychromene-2-carboxylate isomerase n=1 Tax=Wenxinia marina DSM 24838 TaxID=1123501 RepID=A0A0D0NM53_9RHOB|nr:2-hydroxychromene-2-carboxylate isomerase [Wenxinia marina]KIQ69370.1 2-hydroxychromene-2-carboxylate isomerase [Wenxinia marina DSM 24838]GGL57788.1 2-hydroxychromene-2-carboxylate isomerase [Wenxinia marina]
MTEVEFWFDPISPYSYLATTQIDALAARHGATVRWRPVLTGITVTRVMGLKPIPQVPLKSDYSRFDLARLAAMFGVPLNRHGLAQVSPLPAARAFLWLDARDEAQARALIRTLSARLWVDGVDIGAPQAVVAEAAALGADGDALAAALQGPELKRRLSEAVDAAIARGVFGVPFFIVGSEPLWGADRLGMLEFRLREGRWPGPGEWGLGG